MPEGAVYVGRPTVWGNPFRPSSKDLMWCGHSIVFTDTGIEDGPMGADGAVYHFRLVALDRMMREPDWVTPLRGKDLACWCPLDRPCHADVLLELVGGFNEAEMVANGWEVAGRMPDGYAHHYSRDPAKRGQPTDSASPYFGAPRTPYPADRGAESSR